MLKNGSKCFQSASTMLCLKGVCFVFIDLDCIFVCLFKFRCSKSKHAVWQKYEPAFVLLAVFVLNGKLKTCREMKKMDVG